MAHLAFYRGRGTWLDGLIRVCTRSEYSHVEFMPDTLVATARGSQASAWSSSGRDGGVRHKPIQFDHAKWDIVEVPWARDDALQRIARELGARYDFAGVLGLPLGLPTEIKSRWFCSEICAHALGLGRPDRYSPGQLKTLVTRLNRLYATDLRIKHVVR